MFRCGVLHVLSTVITLAFSIDSNLFQDQDSLDPGHSRNATFLDASISLEKKLIMFLMGQYGYSSRYSRPTKNGSEPTLIKFGLELIQLLDLDEKDQVLTTNIWLTFSWFDRRLMWNASQWGGVEKVRIPSKYLWTPDIFLYNYADERLTERRQSLVVVNNTGELQWIPTGIFKSTCSIDTTNFPYDTQECFLMFGSWTCDLQQLNLTFYSTAAMILGREHVKSTEWHITANNARRNERFYRGFPNPYVDLTYRLRIERQANFYAAILILPCVLLSVTTTVVFLLPPEAPAKVQIGIQIFVSFFLLLLLLKDSTPPAASKTPLIGSYYCCNMIMTTVSMFLCCLLVELHFRSDKRSPPPVWMRKMAMNYLAPLLLAGSRHEFKAARASTAATKIVRREKRKSKAAVTRSIAEEVTRSHSQTVYLTGEEESNQSCCYVFGDDPDSIPEKDQPADDSDSEDASLNEPSRFLRSQANIDAAAYIADVRRLIGRVIKRKDKKEAVRHASREWIGIVMILDRCFFVFYCVWLVVSIKFLLPKPEPLAEE